LPKVRLPPVSRVDRPTEFHRAGEMLVEKADLAVNFLRCGAAKSDTLAGIADMPPARRGLRYAGL
jgi:hypothetical protein